MSKATFVTVLFAALGVAGITIAPSRLSPYLYLLAIFYLVLLWNTYYSVRHFSSIIAPGTPSQIVIDTALVILYFLLAFSFDDPLRFNALFTILMAVATLKYAIALPITETPQHLYRKIKIDAMGTIASGLALMGVMLGYAYITMIIWTAVFAITSVRIILVKPLYR